MPTLTPSSASAVAAADRSEDVRVYECAVLYPTGLTQKDEQQLLKDIEELFTEAGGKLVAKDGWGRRGIAYPIKGHSEGNYVIYYYELDPLKLKEIDHALKIMKNVLRHMFVKPPKHYQIVKFSETYETWLKERETVEQRRSREKEEKLQEQVAAKAKRHVERQAERTAEKKPEKKEAMQKDVLAEKLEKLISDDTIDI